MFDWKANRDYYLNNGRCPRCAGKNPVELGTHRCRECALKESERYYSRKQYWIDTGKCSRCGAPLEDTKYRTCQKCRDYAARFKPRKRDENKSSYDRRKEDGRCVRCGIRYAEGGMVYCRECLDKHKKWQQNSDPAWAKKYERRQKLIDAGLCIDCRRPTNNGRKRCDRCLEMRRESTRKYKITRKIRMQAEQERLRLIAANNGGTQ